jgi:hypothetical protein
MRKVLAALFSTALVMACVTDEGVGSVPPPRDAGSADGGNGATPAECVTIDVTPGNCGPGKSFCFGEQAGPKGTCVTAGQEPSVPGCPVTSLRCTNGRDCGDEECCLAGTVTPGGQDKCASISGATLCLPVVNGVRCREPGGGQRPVVCESDVDCPPEGIARKCLHGVHGSGRVLGVCANTLLK